MNCKSGDLAVIVASNDRRNIGKFVKVLGPFRNRQDSWWVFSGSVLYGAFSDWPAGAEVGQYDKNLRPIRDPGDDAQDETLSWLPVPQVDEVPA